MSNFNMTFVRFNHRSSFAHVQGKKAIVLIQDIETSKWFIKKTSNLCNFLQNIYSPAGANHMLPKEIRSLHEFRRNEAIRVFASTDYLEGLQNTRREMGLGETTDADNRFFKSFFHKAVREYLGHDIPAEKEGFVVKVDFALEIPDDRRFSIEGSDPLPPAVQQMELPSLDFLQPVEELEPKGFFQRLLHKIKQFFN